MVKITLTGKFSRLDLPITSFRYAMEKVYHDSQVLVPRRTGALARSGKVTFEETTDGFIGRITYGDEKVHYAIFVHEIPRNYRNGQWKYLEKAAVLNERLVLNSIRLEKVVS